MGVEFYGAMSRGIRVGALCIIQGYARTHRKSGRVGSNRVALPTRSRIRNPARHSACEHPARQIGKSGGIHGETNRDGEQVSRRSLVPQEVLTHPICRLDPIRTPQHTPTPQVATGRQIGSGPDSTRSDPTRDRSRGRPDRNASPSQNDLRASCSCDAHGSAPPLARCPDAANRHGRRNGRPIAGGPSDRLRDQPWREDRGRRRWRASPCT